VRAIFSSFLCIPGDHGRIAPSDVICISLESVAHPFPDLIMETKEKKPKFREYFISDVQTRLKLKFDNLNPVTRAKEMTRFM
jgi:hypothetical protein